MFHVGKRQVKGMWERALAAEAGTIAGHDQPERHLERHDGPLWLT
jgi:hypothetical protein